MEVCFWGSSGPVKQVKEKKGKTQLFTSYREGCAKEIAGKFIVVEYDNREA